MCTFAVWLRPSCPSRIASDHLWGGWIAETQYWPLNGNLGQAQGTTLHGDWVSDQAGAAGDPSSWQLKTDELGLAVVQNGRAPATWKVIWLLSDTPGASGCDNDSLTAAVSYVGEVAPYVCYQWLTDIGFDSQAIAVNPRYVNPASPPANFVVSGSGMSVANGGPVFQFVDMDGNVIGQTAAQSVSSDGTTANVSPSAVAELNAGTYVVLVSNVNSDSSLQTLGSTSIQVTKPYYTPSNMVDNGTDPTGSYGPGSWQVNAQTIYDPAAGGTTSSEYGDCTISGFPTGIQTQGMSLYVVYQNTSNGGYVSFPLEIDATINGSQQTIYLNEAMNGSGGTLSIPIPDGTDISTISLHVNISTDDYGQEDPSQISYSSTTYSSSTVGIYIQ